MPTIALLHSTIRAEEKLLLEAARSRQAVLKLVDIRTAVFDPATFRARFRRRPGAVGLDGQGTITPWPSSKPCGIPVVNPLAVARNCEDKFQTSLLLAWRGDPDARGSPWSSTRSRRSRPSKLSGGFPVVLKPPLGSWGRLLAKVNDGDALDARPRAQGRPGHAAAEGLLSPGIRPQARAGTSGPSSSAARRSAPSTASPAHWITNTARGGTARNCPVDDGTADPLRRASRKRSAADCWPSTSSRPMRGLTVNEVNHTMEFRNSEGPTGVSIAGAIIDYCLRRLDGGAS